MRRYAVAKNTRRGPLFTLEKAGHTPYIRLLRFFHQKVPVMEAITAALLLIVIQFILIPTLLLVATPYVLVKAFFGPGPYLTNVQAEYEHLYRQLRSLFRK
jgi:hypothetical protein